MMMLGMVLGLSLSNPIYAGPYFNPPEGGPKEEMAEFENLLNQARKSIIDMLDSWESDPDAAKKNQGEAVDTLSRAEKVLLSIPEPKVTGLIVSSEFLTSDVQTAAYSEVAAALEPLGLKAPLTYGEMLDNTIQLTTRFRETIAEIEIIPFPEGWEQSRKAIRADAEMVQVGSAFSALAQAARSAN